MSENPQSFVSPDKLSRPEQADAASQAAVRFLIVGNAVARAAQALTPMLANIVATEALQYSVEPAQQAQPAPAQAPQQYAEYQTSTGPTPSYDGFSPSANDAYLDAIATDESRQPTGQPTLSDEAQAMAEEARRLAGDAYGDQNNYEVAG